MKKRVLLFMMAAIVLSVSSHVSAKEVITLDLSKPATPETIEYAEGGYWKETFDDQNYPYLVFSPFRFTHVSDGNGYGGASWDGFTVSKNASTAKPTTTFSWGCMAGGGIQTDGSGNVVKDGEGKVATDNTIPYLLGYWSEFMDGNPASYYMTVSFDGEKTYKPVGFYVCNHPAPYYNVMEGDAFTTAFSQNGDFFKLIIGGVDAEGNDLASTVEYFLAKYENDALTVNKSWEWVDLSSLGEAKQLYFKMASSDVGLWGMNTGAYFCIDKLQIETTGETALPEVSVTAQVKVYPNPVVDRFTVQSESAIARIQLTDLAGKTVLTRSAIDSSLVEVDASALPKGIYLLKVETTQKTYTQKIIKK